ncbi:TonB family protein [Sphingomonas pituitosa]|uniref:TonB family protein n=1 Tax=Sphingomonas pituitosa TaxID=99597 RepID=UPI00082D9D5E|nr:TonB family protein [Sphingomonas pituitosa]
MTFPALLLSLAVPAAPAQVLPPPPDSVAVQANAARKLFLIEPTAGAARCDGGPAALVRGEAPFPVAALGSGGTAPLPVTLSFRIDASGRPLAIKRTDSAEWRSSRLYYSDGDVIPAFAASRFAPGERNNCTIRFEPRIVAASEAPSPAAMRYFVAPHARLPGEQALFRRFHPTDTNCIAAGTPKVRLRAYPAFEDIAVAPGSWTYAMAAFDIDAKGRPVHVRIIGSDGNAALDRATVRAVERSRFAPEARHGCTYPYYRRSEDTLAAPTPPDQASFRPAGAQCPGGDTGWTGMPKLQFPAGFAERRIEGWAIIGYDVAPWGQTGNVRVLAAEPAAAFGEKAREIVMQARQAPSASGRGGCIDIVRFVMPKKDKEQSEDDS